MRILIQTLSATALLAMVGIVPASAQDVTVDMAVARAVVDRMPVDEGTKFPRDVGEVWCWTRVKGAKPGTTIEHVWMRGSEKMAIVPLEVGSSSWRTYSSKTIPPEWAGEWYVYVRDTDGYIYGLQSFTVGDSI